MADTPQFLTLKRNRDLSSTELHVRRALVSLLAAFLIAGALNVFGQRPSTASAHTSTATLKVYSPTRVRGGLYFEARFHITAHTELKDAQLVLGTGWLEGMTINTIEPSPIGEASHNGKLALDLGHIPAGQSYILYVQMQVNPTNVGHRPQRVALYDGEERIAYIAREITVYP